MRVGILGSGPVGQMLGTGFAAVGNQVRIGTRTLDNPKLQEWKKAAGSRASVGSFEDAAQFGEIVVLATRGSVALDVVRIAGAQNFAGKVVIDVTNPLVFQENGPPSLFVGHSDSLGEQVQRTLPDAKVVKAFNTVGNAHFFRPRFPGGPPDMFIAGNDPGAKRRVTEILSEFGWPAIDLGGITSARVLEPMSLAWVGAAFSLGSRDIAFKLLRKKPPAAPSKRAGARRKRRATR